MKDVGTLKELDVKPVDVVELVRLLAEARADLAAYVDEDWPAQTRFAYPAVDAKWRRDMVLCWQIDAALARVKGG